MEYFEFTIKIPKVRFSLRTLLVLVSVVALTLGAYQLRRQATRSRVDRGFIAYHIRGAAGLGVV